MTALDVHPVTPDRWDDLTTLFGPNGACAGCWCMWWRVRAKDWEAYGAEGRREALHDLVHTDGPAPGLLGYRDGVPAGWVALAPRTDYGRILRSPNLAPADAEAADESVWSVPCFFIHRTRRRQGVAAGLLDAAISWAAEQGAAAVEGYPVDTGGARKQSSGLYTGVPSMFLAAGFEEVARRSATRPVMRRAL